MVRSAVGPAQASYRFAVQCSTIYHEIDSLIVNAAVGMNATTVIWAFVVEGVRHFIRVTKCGRITHAAVGTRNRDILTMQPLSAGRIITQAICLIVILSPHI